MAQFTESASGIKIRVRFLAQSSPTENVTRLFEFNLFEENGTNIGPTKSILIGRFRIKVKNLAKFRRDLIVLIVGDANFWYNNANFTFKNEAPRNIMWSLNKFRSVQSRLISNIPFITSDSGYSETPKVVFRHNSCNIYGAPCTVY